MTDDNDNENQAPEVIDCVDCGGRCHLLNFFDGLATYRCEDCRDRWDVLFEAERE